SRTSSSTSPKAKRADRAAGPRGRASTAREPSATNFPLSTETNPSWVRSTRAYWARPSRGPDATALGCADGRRAGSGVDGLRRRDRLPPTVAVAPLLRPRDGVLAHLL